MRKLTIALCVVLLASLLASALTDEKYMVNGRQLTDMTIEELYALEDEVIAAARVVFDNNTAKTASGEIVGDYVVNAKTEKYHYPDCYSAVQIGVNRQFVRAAPSELEARGYDPCGMCRPRG